MPVPVLYELLAEMAAPVEDTATEQLPADVTWNWLEAPTLNDADGLFVNIPRRLLVLSQKNEEFFCWIPLPSKNKTLPVVP